MDGLVLGFLFLFLLPGTCEVQFLQAVQSNTGMSLYSRKSENCSHELECARMCFKDTACASFAYSASDELCMFFPFHLTKDENRTSGTGFSDADLAFNIIGLCEDDYYFVFGMCFGFFESTVTFLEAQAACEEDQADLLEIQNSTKMDHVHLFKDLLGIPWEYNRYWLRPSDQLSEGDWFWSNGDPITERWCPKEPSDTNNEDCMVLYTKYSCFNDIPCHRQQEFICEKKPTR